VRLTATYLNYFVPLEINEATCSQVKTNQENTFLEANKIYSLSDIVTVYTAWIGFVSLGMVHPRQCFRRVSGEEGGVSTSSLLRPTSPCQSPAMQLHSFLVLCAL